MKSFKDFLKAKDLSEMHQYGFTPRRKFEEPEEEEVVDRKIDNDVDENIAARQFFNFTDDQVVDRTMLNGAKFKKLKAGADPSQVEHYYKILAYEIGI